MSHAPNLNHTIPGGSMSQVTEAMDMAIHWIQRGDVERAESVLREALSSASPPVEQSELTADVNDPSLVKPFAKPRIPPPVTEEVERAIERLNEGVIGHMRGTMHESIVDAVECLIAALKEGHSLSTVSGVVK